jgi:hypothetical protein
LSKIECRLQAPQEIALQPRISQETTVSLIPSRNILVEESNAHTIFLVRALCCGHIGLPGEAKFDGLEARLEDSA